MPNCICGGHLEGGDHHVQRRATLRGNLNLMPFTNTTYLAPHALVTPAGFSGPAYLVVLPVPHIIITNIRFSIFNYLEGVAPALAGLCSIGSRRLARLNPTPAFSCNYTGFLRSGKKRNAEVSSRCGHVNRNWRRRAKPCATRGRTIRDCKDQSQPDSSTQIASIKLGTCSPQPPRNPISSLSIITVRIRLPCPRYSPGSRMPNRTIRQRRQIPTLFTGIALPPILNFSVRMPKSPRYSINVSKSLHPAQFRDFLRFRTHPRHRPALANR